MENQLLRDRDTLPSEEVLAGALGAVYPLYEWFMQTVTCPEYGLVPEWRYYNDGKAWLCKVTGGSGKTPKTVFWLSAWEGFFKVSFYFLERHLDGIAALGLDEANYTLQNEWGKMIPLIFNVDRRAQLADVLKVAAFKKTAK